MPSPRSFKLFFIVGSTTLFFSFSRSISVILVVFLVVIRRPKKSFPSHHCLSSRRFMVLASYHPLELFQFVRYSFLPIRSISGVIFRFDHSEAITEDSLAPSFQLHSFPYLCRCLIQTFFNQLVISLFFCILFHSSIFVRF